jgi:hypothetical protein
MILELRRMRFARGRPEARDLPREVMVRWLGVKPYYWLVCVLRGKSTV